MWELLSLAAAADLVVLRSYEEETVLQLGSRIEHLVKLPFVT